MPRKRGAYPTSRHRLGRATPARKLADPDIPSLIVTIPTRLSYWLNDQYGDCVTAEAAAAAVADSIWNKGVAAPTVWIDDQAVYDWADAHGDLDGAEIGDVLDQMTTDPLVESDGTKILEGPKQYVDYGDFGAMMSALSFGPLKLGVAADQYENVVGRSNGWVLSGAYTDQNEDHCVSCFGGGQLADLAKTLNITLPDGVDPSANGFLVFTWSTVGIVDHTSLIRTCGEAWLRRPTTIVSK